MLSGLNVVLLTGVAVLLVLYLLRRRTRIIVAAHSAGGDSEASGQQEPGAETAPLSTQRRSRPDLPPPPAPDGTLRLWLTAADSTSDSTDASATTGRE